MYSQRSQHIRLFLLASGITLILTLLSSCIKEEFDTENLDTSFRFSPGVAVPIGYARWQMDELLDSLSSTQISPDDNGFMNLIYREFLESGTQQETGKGYLNVSKIPGKGQLCPAGE